MKITFLLLAVGFSAFAQVAPNPVPRLKNIIWIWFENTPHSQMMLQRYTKNLLAKYPSAQLSAYTAQAASAQANAFMLIAGTDFGVKDNVPTRIFAPTVIDLLESKNIPWKAYAEDFPGSCYLSEGSGDYRRYRVPFLSSAQIQSDRYECMKIVNFASLDDDVKYGNLPSFSIVIPNLKNSGATSNAVTADSTLKRILDPMLLNPAFLDSTTVFVSTLNNSNNAQGKAEMFTLILGRGVAAPSLQVKTAYSHPNLLKTIELGLGLGELSQADQKAEPILGLWK